MTETLTVPPEPIASLPWGHNLALLHKLDSATDRLWYARKAVEHGWSRAVLMHHIEAKLHQREGKAVTNFQRTLPPAQSDLAEQTLKTRIILISSRWAARRGSAISNWVCSIISGSSCWNSAWVSRSSGGNFIWRSAGRIITSTCCSII